MACNAFLKICKQTSEQFTMVQQNESEAFVRDIIRKLPETTKKFNNDTLMYIFY